MFYRFFGGPVILCQSFSKIYPYGMSLRLIVNNLSEEFPWIYGRQEYQGKFILLITISIITCILTGISLAVFRYTPYDIWIGNQWPKYHIPVIPIIIGVFCLIVSGVGISAYRKKKGYKILLTSFSLNLLFIFLALFVVGGMVYLE